jgi:hypothetical protein
MRKYLYITLIALAVNNVSAEDVLYQSDFAALRPKENLFKADSKAKERQSLFPDAKPADRVNLQPRRNRFTGAVKAIGTKEGALKLVPVAGKNYPLKRHGEILLPLAKAGNNVTVQFTVKTENFLKRKTKNYFFLYIGGVNIWLRGDSKDLRCYNTDTKRYERIIKIENNKQYDLKITLSFGEKALFSMLIDGKEVLKEKLQRGNLRGLKTIKMVFRSEQESSYSPVPAIYLNNIKITNNQ